MAYEFNQAIQRQNEFMVNLVLIGNLNISNDMVLVALKTGQEHILKILTSHLITNKKFYGKFRLRPQELNFIIEKNHIDLIEDFKYFIGSDTACCVLNTFIEHPPQSGGSVKGEKCLEKILELKIISKSYHIYLLLKTSITHSPMCTSVIGKFVTKRMVNYAISDNNSVILNLVLSRLVKKLSVLELNKVISRLLSQKNKTLLKNECRRVLNKYCQASFEPKMKCIRI